MWTKFKNSLFIFSPQQFSLCSKTWLWLTAPRLFLPQIVLLVTKIQVLDSLTIKPIIKNYFQSHKILHMKKKTIQGPMVTFCFLCNSYFGLFFLSKASHCLVAGGDWQMAALSFLQIVFFAPKEPLGNNKNIC